MRRRDIPPCASKSSFCIPEKQRARSGRRSYFPGCEITNQAPAVRAGLEHVTPPRRFVPRHSSQVIQHTPLHFGHTILASSFNQSVGEHTHQSRADGRANQRKGVFITGKRWVYCEWAPCRGTRHPIACSPQNAARLISNRRGLRGRNHFNAASTGALSRATARRGRKEKSLGIL